MSRTITVLLGLALVWLTAWTIAGHYMRAAGSEKIAQSEHLSTPATRVERGAEIRMDGVVEAGPQVTAPLSETPCLAAVARISIMSSYYDSQDHLVRDSTYIATRIVGPEHLVVVLGDAHVELPLERWSPQESTGTSIEQLPARLRVSVDDIARAKETARGTLGNFWVSEAVLHGGDHFFVAGQLEDRDGPLRLEADQVLGRVELFAGTQAQLVEKLGGSGSGLRIAGWILGAGLGPLPLTIIGVVLLLRSRRAASGASA